MNVPLYISNPKDGKATYTKIRGYRSDDSYASVMLTVDIDLTTRDRFGSGYTATVDISGLTTYLYKFDYYNPTTGAVSDKSEAMAFGSSHAINQARIILKDTDSANYVFTNDELAASEARGVELLFPELLKSEVDTSLTITEDVRDYDLPIGVYTISSVFKGTPGTDDYVEVGEFEILDDITLRLGEGEVSDALPLEVHYKRAYRNAGEVPLNLQKIIVAYILYEAFSMLANDRGIKFKAFQAIQRDSDIRPETLINMANVQLDEAKKIKANIYRG